jgi:hypothetical protein
MLLRPEHAYLVDHAERETKPHWLDLAADFQGDPGHAIWHPSSLKKMTSPFRDQDRRVEI